MNIINKQIEVLVADKPFAVEISGSANAGIAVIFVHGFGVKRDSRQLFTDIKDSLPDSMLCIGGDFSEIDSDFVQAIPFSSQVKRLQTITEFIQHKFKLKHIVYIGHSQGCIVIGKLKPKNCTIFLLAPPVLSPYKEFINTPGWNKPGSKLDIKGKSRLLRSDLAIEVGPEFWMEFQKINAGDLYSKLTRHNQVKIIFAGADEVLGRQTAPAPIYTTSIANASHDFKGIARSEVIKIIANT